MMNLKKACNASMFKAWDWRWLEQGTRTENFHLQGKIFLVI